MFYEDWRSASPEDAFAYVHAHPEGAIMHKRWTLSLEKFSSMILYQVSELRRTANRFGRWNEAEVDVWSSLVMGASPLDIVRLGPDSRVDPDMPLRVSPPAHVAALSRLLNGVSEEAFLTAHAFEAYEGSPPGRPYDLSLPIYRETFAHILANLRSFYAVAAGAGECMLYAIG
jgi:hypothetical protein